MLEKKALLDSVYVDDTDDIKIVAKKLLEVICENKAGAYHGHLRCIAEIHLESVHTFHNGVK